MGRPDLVIAVDVDATSPPYVQIFEQIRAAIERGDLIPGDTLPPVRQLAGDLGVAPNTVARAYAELRAARWTSGDERRATTVSTGTSTRTRASRRHALAESVATFLASLASRGYAADEIALELRKRIAALDRT